MRAAWGPRELCKKLNRGATVARSALWPLRTAGPRQPSPALRGLRTAVRHGVNWPPQLPLSSSSIFLPGTLSVEGSNYRDTVRDRATEIGVWEPASRFLTGYLG